MSLRIDFQVAESTFNTKKVQFVRSVAAVIRVDQKWVTANKRQAASRRHFEGILNDPHLRAHETLSTSRIARDRGGDGGIFLRADVFEAEFETKLPRSYLKEPGSKDEMKKSITELLGEQLVNNGLPSYKFTFRGVFVFCGTGWQNSTQGCQKCPKGFYQNSTKSETCLSCPQHSNTSENASIYRTDCECNLDQGYRGPKGGPCMPIPDFTRNDAADIARMVTGPVIGMVAANVLMQIGAAYWGGARRKRFLTSSGISTLILQVQYMNLVGRIGGPRVPETLHEFANGFSWCVPLSIRVCLFLCVFVSACLFCVMCVDTSTR